MNLITQETCPIPEYRFIPLGKELFAKVDVDDFDWLNQWKWKPDYIKQTNSFRAIRQTKKKDSVSGKVERKTYLMHREIVKAKNGLVVDHWNHDSLDNRKENLRECTHAENSSNMKRHKENKYSKFKGVYPNKARWRAVIMQYGKYIHIGTFDTQIEAAKAYDSRAIELFGEFAYLNFPE